MITKFESHIHYLDGEDELDDDFERFDDLDQEVYEIVGLPSGNIFDVTTELLWVLEDWNYIEFNNTLNLYVYADEDEEAIYNIAYCESYEIDDYIVNEDGSIDVDGDVDLSFNKMENGYVPIKFRFVDGDFLLNNCGLTSLKNFPRTVSGDCDISENHINYLYGCPDKIGGSFYCSNNDLSSLEGGPDIVRGRYICNNNHLRSLDYLPFIHPDRLVYLPNDLLSQEKIDRYWEQCIMNNKVTEDQVRHLVSYNLFKKYDGD